MKKDPNELKKLKEECVAIYEQSEMLKQDVTWTEQQIRKFMEKYPDEYMTLLSWDEKEAVAKEADTLMGRLNITLKALRKLDGEYEILRQRANKIFGREILKKLPFPLPDKLEDLDDPDDESNWWKN